MAIDLFAQAHVSSIDERISGKIVAKNYSLCYRDIKLYSHQSMKGRLFNDNLGNCQLILRFKDSFL